MSDLLARFRDALSRRAFAAVDRVALDMERVAIEKAPKSLGQLQGRIHGKADQEGDVIRATLRCDSPYGRYVEEGTGPAVGHDRYMPPPGALRLWVQRTVRPASTNADAEATLTAVENAIRWKIYMKGTRPQPFIAPAAEQGRKAFRAALVGAVRQAVKEALHG
ncbi:MAG: hypothetical protein AB1824_01295 [Acidobacteriota bacterium]